eukprot:11080861-Alexandrium_andersonii.AAC.1
MVDRPTDTTVASAVSGVAGDPPMRKHVSGGQVVAWWQQAVARSHARRRRRPQDIVDEMSTSTQIFHGVVGAKGLLYVPP